jgi:type IV pilus assembly protein PilC
MFNATISLKSLALICRSLATLLQSGVPLVRSLTTVSQRIGGTTCRKRMREVVNKLTEGEDVREAFRSQGDYFPDLFVDMVCVAEDTGALPEVLLSLADHYENLVQLKRNFIGQLTMPVVQLVAAILIISFVIFITGMIGSQNGGKPLDVLGWGLTGTSGALIFCGSAFGSLFGLFLAYVLLGRGLKQERRLHGLFLRIPVLGSCLRSFAVARFAWAFALTQQAGMRIVPSLTASLKATANHAFIGATPRMTGLIKQGEDLSTVLYDSQLFPVELLEMVQVAETSGTVPEMLEHMSPRFEDQARRSLSALATALGWVVWALVAGFIIFAIFSLAQFYVNMLKDPFKNM